MPVKDHAAVEIAPVREYVAARRDRRPAYRRAGEQAFVWTAWAAACAFWAFTLSSAIGIFRDVFRPAAEQVPGGPGGGELGLILLSVVAFFLFAVAVLWTSLRWATRDKSLDPVTEASTRALYNAVERAGGDDMVTRGPGARKPFERDSFRPA
jgi:hypothetical protein